MSTFNWPKPHANQPERYVMLDMLDGPDVFLETFNTLLPAEDHFDIETVEGDDTQQITITHRGTRHDLPLLTGTLHDPYIVVSSIGAILKGRFRLYFEDCFDFDDASEDFGGHAICIMPELFALGGRVPAHLEPVQIGIDHLMTGIDDTPFQIPYVGHICPDFAERAAKAAAASAGTMGFMNALFAGLIDGDITDDKLREALASLKTDPMFGAALEGRSDAELIAFMRAELESLEFDDDALLPTSKTKPSGGKGRKA